MDTAAREAYLRFLTHIHKRFNTKGQLRQWLWVHGMVDMPATATKAQLYLAFARNKRLLDMYKAVARIERWVQLRRKRVFFANVANTQDPITLENVQFIVPACRFLYQRGNARYCCDCLKLASYIRTTGKYVDLFTHVEFSDEELSRLWVQAQQEVLTKAQLDGIRKTREMADSLLGVLEQLLAELGSEMTGALFADAETDGGGLRLDIVGFILHRITEFRVYFMQLCALNPPAALLSLEATLDRITTNPRFAGTVQCPQGAPPLVFNRAEGLRLLVVALHDLSYTFGN